MTKNWHNFQKVKISKNVNIYLKLGWLVGGFICLKHIEGPTYPHLGKVGQLVNIQWYSFMPLLVVLLASVFFVYHLSSALRCFRRECFIRRTRVEEHPLVCSILCSYCLCVGSSYLFYFLHLFFFIHGWVGLHIFLHLQCWKRDRRDVEKRQERDRLWVVWWWLF